MATQKLQPTRALNVIPSDYAAIPSPNLLIQGISTGSGFSALIDSNINFYDDNSSGRQYKVNVGDIVYYPSIGSATIIEVLNENVLLLDYDLFNGDDGVDYFIYQEGAQTGLGNQGCVLYIGTGGSLTVTTSGNDIVAFQNIQDGTFFPINVLKVASSGTTCTDIIALW